MNRYENSVLEAGWLVAVPFLLAIAVLLAGLVLS
jgi:hypothetical protein